MKNLSNSWANLWSINSTWPSTKLEPPTERSTNTESSILLSCMYIPKLTWKNNRKPYFYRSIHLKNRANWPNQRNDIFIWSISICLRNAKSLIYETSKMLWAQWLALKQKYENNKISMRIKFICLAKYRTLKSIVYKILRLA